MATTVNLFMNTSNFDTTTGLFTDVALTTCAPDGWYSDGDRHRQMKSCTLLPSVACQDCPSVLWYSDVGTTCVQFCDSTVEAIDNQLFGHDYATIASGDSISLANGWYAVSNSESSTTTPYENYKIIRVQNNIIVPFSVSQCGSTVSGGFGCVPI
tara:strand:- start:6 stop:470 length:465 start_codon:yes stop_codon:yes gene_type:complete